MGVVVDDGPFGVAVCVCELGAFVCCLCCVCVVVGVLCVSVFCVCVWVCDWMPSVLLLLLLCVCVCVCCQAICCCVCVCVGVPSVCVVVVGVGPLWLPVCVVSCVPLSVGSVVPVGWCWCRVFIRGGLSWMPSVRPWVSGVPGAMVSVGVSLLQSLGVGAWALRWCLCVCGELGADVGCCALGCGGAER